MYGDLNKLSDEELIELSRNGDGSVTEFILEKYRNFVRAKSRTYFFETRLKFFIYA